MITFNDETMNQLSHV